MQCFTGDKFFATSELMAFWSLGDVVRKLREKRGWTQDELAEAAGVNTGTIVTLEASGERTKQETLQRVALALNVTVSRIHQIAEAIPEGVSPAMLQSAARQPPSVQAAMTKIMKAPKLAARKARH